MHLFAKVFDIKTQRKSGKFSTVRFLGSLMMGNRRTNTFWPLQNARIQKIAVFLEMPFSKKSYQTETNKFK